MRRLQGQREKSGGKVRPHAGVGTGTLATGCVAGRCKAVLYGLVTCVLSCYQTYIYLSGIRDMVCKNFGPGGFPQPGCISINDIAMYDTCESRRVSM